MELKGEKKNKRENSHDRDRNAMKRQVKASNTDTERTKNRD